MATSCTHERDVLAAAATEWARPEDAWLAAHAAACPDCLGAMAAVAAIREQVAHDLASARPAASAVAWWRLERRLREDRARAARRTLTVAHGVAGAAAAGAVLATAETLSPFFRPSLASAWAALTTRPDWLVLSPGWAVPLALMALAVAVLAPAAVYLGLGRD
jgi:hypothetical protein